MTDRINTFRHVRQQLADIRATALAIDLDTKSSPASRAKARRIMNVADAALETVIELAKLPTPEQLRTEVHKVILEQDRHNAHLGGTE